MQYIKVNLNSKLIVNSDDKKQNLAKHFAEDKFSL